MGDFFSLFFIGVGSSIWALKIFWGGLQKDIFRNFILRYSIFWHTLEVIVELITFIASCYSVTELCNWTSRGLLKSWYEWLKETASGSCRSLMNICFIIFSFGFVSNRFESLPREKELRFLSSLMVILLNESEPGRVGALDSSICTEKPWDRYTSTACYHRKVTQQPWHLSPAL